MTEVGNRDTAFTVSTKLLIGVRRLQSGQPHGHLGCPLVQTVTHTLSVHSYIPNMLLALLKSVRAWPLPLPQPHSLANTPTWASSLAEKEERRDLGVRKIFLVLACSRAPGKGPPGP